MMISRSRITSEPCCLPSCSWSFNWRKSWRRPSNCSRAAVRILPRGRKSNYALWTTGQFTQTSCPICRTTCPRSDTKKPPHGEMILCTDINRRYGRDARRPNFSIDGRTSRGGNTNMPITLRFRQESSSHSNRKPIMTYEIFCPSSPPLWVEAVLGTQFQNNEYYLLL